MKLTILGSGTCAVTAERSCSCYFLKIDDLNVLLDIGFGAMRRLVDAGIDYRDIDAIVCSHCHLDHVGDLAPFLMATRFTPGFQREKPLTLIGPTGFAAFLYGCRDLFGEWLLPADDYPLKIVELDAEQYQLGACLIEAQSMNHSRPTNGYRFEHHGAVCVYSADTGPCDNLVNLAQQADVAIFECSFPDDQPFEFHLTPQQAGRMAQQAGVKKLLLTHFYPMMENVDVIGAAAHFFDGDIDLAEDFKVFDI
jgi:ribonuclease BN (tRNA processing enzyme)